MSKTYTNFLFYRYMGKGHGYLIVYSITDPQSFEQTSVLFDELVRAKEAHEPYNIPIILVGNKSDLEDTERCVTIEEGQEQAKKFGENCKFMETSAKLRKNIDESFEELVRLINKGDSVEETPFVPSATASKPRSESSAKSPTKAKSPARNIPARTPKKKCNLL